MTGQQRTELAYAAVQAHKEAYYDNGEYRKADFWDYAEIFEIIEDLYEVTGDKALFAQFEEMYQFTQRAYTNDWHRNPFNDDIMWLTIALTRAYLYTGERKYLDTARLNFNKTYARAVSDELGGGLFWRVENQSKNTCVNCPGAVAAMFLFDATGDESYADKAAYCFDWAYRMMFEPDTGKVYDAINLDGRINKWSSTYNQGTFIGSALMLWKKTGDENYRTAADMAAKYVKDDMYHGGIMNNEESGNDLPGFKGILARYIRRYAALTGNGEYLDWLRTNADAAWENRNSAGIMQTQLGLKTEEKEYDVFTASAAVSVIVNAVD
ncbi:MAG: glycoside hydrolase family 76 protein [Clostridia bacterium]|nr:glycoside hydrolase family 76 protein [Clostridia bacterium]